MNPSLKWLCKQLHQAQVVLMNHACCLAPVSLTIKPRKRPLRTQAKQGNKIVCFVGLHWAFLAICTSPMSFAQECKNLPTVSELLFADQTDESLQLPSDKIKANREARMAKLDKIIECDQIESAWGWRKASSLASQSNEERDLYRAMEYANRASQLEPESRAAQLMAATAYDRILVSRGQLQWYGTQYKGKTLLPIARCVISNDIRRYIGISLEVIATQPEVCTDRVR